MSNQEDDNVRPLADLNVPTVRRENAAVDDQISSLESELADLREEVADLENERDTAEERADEAEQLLEKFHDAQRDEQLARIRAANEEVDDEDEVDISALEDASVDQLETVADLLEVTAGETVEVSNEGADLSQVDDGEKSLEEELAEKADEFGLGQAYRKMVNGESPAATYQADSDDEPPEAGLARGADGDIPMEDIVSTIQGE